MPDFRNSISDRDERVGRPTPTWTPITEWDAHFKPMCLSLEYRTDNPFATE